MSEQQKKILIYNWAQFDDKNSRGGGVSVYIRNLIAKYLEQNVSVDFVSSGCHYDLFSNKTYFRKTANMFDDKGVSSFEIVNSPVKAPAHDSFFEPKECLDNEEIVDVFLKLLDSLGEHHEIHFHNIEGISTRLFERLKEVSSAKVVVWLHNYHWICPQIDLFKDNTSVCLDYLDGAACLGCLDSYSDLNRKKRIHSLVSFLELSKIFRNKFGAFFTKYIRICFELFRASLDSYKHFGSGPDGSRTKDFSAQTVTDTKMLKTMLAGGEGFKRWRQVNIARMDSSVDCVLAVSELVRDKFEHFGIAPDKINVLPLGMDVYNPDFISLGKNRSANVGSPLRIGYIGYATPAKGLPFFLATLESLPESLKGKFSVHIVSKLTEVARRRLVRLASKLDVKLTEGYARSELNQLAKSVDLVVVPSIWWETYNQVAYEMIMHGVPVFISDTTGIAAYTNSNYVFTSGVEASLALLLTTAIERPESLVDYWQNQEFALQGMEQHFANLQAIIDTSKS